MPPPPSLQPFSNTAEPARGSSLHTIKTQQRAKEEEERARQKRRKGILTMMLQLLQEMGYGRSLEALQNDSGVVLGRSVVPADNMDITTIFTEYEDYYEFRFGRRPRYYRAVDAADGAGHSGANAVHFGAVSGEGQLERPRGPPQGGMGRPRPVDTSNATNTSSSTASAAPSSAPAVAGGAGGRQRHPLPANKGDASSAASAGTGAKDASMLGLDGTAIGSSSNATKASSSSTGGGGDAAGHPPRPSHKNPHHSTNANTNTNTNGDEDDDLLFGTGRALKPLPRFASQELADLAATIQRDILDQNPNVPFSGIAELDVAKQLLKESVVMPVKYPELFAGIVRPWRGILLFGPPGTGKTMLAKAVATECRTTFFNISASSIVSKWRGDSEKLVRMLFDLAVHYAPSTIFIDELDAIMSARSSDGSEHEGSRRMKTELLVQMDGLSKRAHGDVVFVLAASNVPWDLDSAVLRRLEKRILVPLPSAVARAQMFRANLSATAEAQLQAAQHGRRRGGGGGGGGNAAAAACPLTDEELERCAASTDGYSGADIDIICREATMRTIRHLIARLEDPSRGALPTGPLRRPPLTVADVLSSIDCTQSSARQQELGRFQAWAEQHGSTLST